MRVLLIGRGQIGSALYDHLRKNHEVLVWEKDLAELDRASIGYIHPDAIVNAAGKTDLAWCEANAREAFRSNVEAPCQLYREIVALNREESKHIRFLHFSSGCIWDGPFDEHGDPFTPEHPARPAAYYSWTKAAADELLSRESMEHLAILRPRQVFSSSTSPRNTLQKLVRYDALIDTPNSMSSVDVIAKTVEHCITTNEEWLGIWNVYDAGVTTPYEVGEVLWQHALRPRPMRLEKSELDQFHKPRRVDTVLYDPRFERIIKPESIHTTLARTVADLASRVSARFLK